MIVRASATQLFASAAAVSVGYVIAALIGRLVGLTDGFESAFSMVWGTLGFAAILLFTRGEQ